ncbi:MAG: hypothetical protein RLZZ21_1366 [Planctomycetota bacterium]|jgi:hypothetical protein
MQRPMLRDAGAERHVRTDSVKAAFFAVSRASQNWDGVFGTDRFNGNSHPPPCRKTRESTHSRSAAEHENDAPTSRPVARVRRSRADRHRGSGVRRVREVRPGARRAHGWLQADPRMHGSLCHVRPHTGLRICSPLPRHGRRNLGNAQADRLSSVHGGRGCAGSQYRPRTRPDSLRCGQAASPSRSSAASSGFRRTR